MSKAVMISIRPKWCEKICSGEKTIEVRKTRPKLETPFKCYIYRIKGTVPHIINDKWVQMEVGGTIIGEFVCDRIFPIDVYDNGCIKDWNFECMWQACLPYEGIAAYIGREKRGYGWHISDLKIYDAPKDLDEFAFLRETKFASEPVTIKRPPQSWYYVEEQK